MNHLSLWQRRGLSHKQDGETLREYRELKSHPSIRGAWRSCHGTFGFALRADQGPG
jgi:hypothetical protein